MTRETKTITVVKCAKLGEELPALDKPPFPGPLGERIYNEISRMAWNMWQEHATLLINHYGLNMADPNAQELLFEQMEEFFFGEGRGQMPIAGAPSAKGGGPARK
ncbi:MAG: oxidative damage protection protein [Chloroflexi bacterium]|nr:MAG: oxidative damage protection protein [Chloroflexota bacterium]